MTTFVYRFSQNGILAKRVFDALEEAIAAACADQESGDACPHGIESAQGKTLLTEDDIFDEWEKRYPGEAR